MAPISENFPRLDSEERGIAVSHDRELSPRALELFAAARRVVDRDGADGLTLRAVAAEAQVPSSLPIYYFSSMERLEALLLDSLWREQVARHRAAIQVPPPTAAERIDVLVDFHSEIARDLGIYRTYFELVTHVIRNPATRRTVADMYAGYRNELNLPLLLASGQATARSAQKAAVMLGGGEGLPLGLLLDDDEAEMERAFSLLAHLFKDDVGVLGEWPPGTEVLARDVDPGTQPVEPPENEARGGTPGLLISAGITLLHKRGFRAITFSHVAAEAHESKSLISYHFKNKEGYLDALVRRVFSDWSAQILRVMETPGRLNARALIRSLYGSRSVLVSAILVQPALRDGSARLPIARAAYTRTLAGLARHFQGEHRGERGYSPVTAATLFLAVLNGLALQQLYEPKNFDLAGAIDVFLSMLPPQDPAA